ncbi:uncharacterized protein LOC121877937 isoform X2 [Homarus americanus]|uniref:Uncharacterized protein n=2 Tax=Homarus americanus TaxID=6706 RepID=A0A8J5JQP4_HOMAM|nr:uncharacterized protein LOC121877937 isoform X2 [Homarus americanus]KAG7159088.1 hypothetical protein Hamer_G023175 [Homarus americanus]
MGEAGVRLRLVWVCLAACIFVIASYTHHTTLAPTTLQPSLLEVHPPNDSFIPWWESGRCTCEEKVCVPDVDVPFDPLDGVGGTCGRRAWEAGDGQHVLSFSLYGDKRNYWRGLDSLLKKVRRLYPGWKVRVYTNPRFYVSTLCPLLHQHDHLYLCDVTNLPQPLGNLTGIHRMMWRVVPLGDPQLRALMIRDTDSAISRREAAAVREWLASSKHFHVMRDHPAHNAPIMGGLWGARWGLNRQLVPENAKFLSQIRDKMFKDAYGEQKHGKDQEILAVRLWPKMAGNVMAHDSYWCKFYGKAWPWPTKRENRYFVGSTSYRDPPGNTKVPKPCPVRCRPPEHHDWIYC